jgi:hypothetical protein
VLVITVDGVVITKLLKRRPTGGIEFDVYDIVKDHVSHYFPHNAFGWQNSNATNNKSIVNVSVAIGERFGLVPVTYPASATVIYDAWNASISVYDRSSYSPAQYTTQYSSKLLNDYGDKIKCNSFQSLPFYLLNYFGGDTTNVGVTTYDVNNNMLGQYTIPVPVGMLINSTPNRLLIFDGSYTGLLSIPSIQVTVNVGTYPIITPSVAKWNLNFYKSFVWTKSYNVELNNCEGSILFYVNKKGAWDFIKLSGLKKEGSEHNKTYFKPRDQYFRGSYTDALQSTTNFIASPIEVAKRAITNTYENKLTLMSDYLTEAEYTRMQDLYGSPNYLLQISANEWKWYSCEDLKFEKKQKSIDKLLQITVNLTEGITERRQTNGR